MAQTKITQPKPTTNGQYKKGNYIPVILCLVLFIAGALISVFGKENNSLQRFCFVTFISLGAGLGATYLTGQITGGGKYGFINIKSITGGFAVWLIVLIVFIFYFPKSVETDMTKFYALAKLPEFGISANFIDKSGSSIPLNETDLYNRLETVTCNRTTSSSTLIIKFKFTSDEIKNYTSFEFYFDEAFRKKLGATLHIDGWSFRSIGNGTFLYYPTKFSESLEFKIPYLN